MSEKNIPEPQVTECTTCNGYGEMMQMVCYGDMPIEKREICPDCNGTGLIAARSAGEEE